MKTKRLRVEQLRNEEWFQFYTEFKDVVETHTPQALQVEALFDFFKPLYQQADEALEIIRKSASTEELAEADNDRDQIFRGLCDSLKPAHSHFDPTKRQAARRLQVVFDQYGNVTRKPYDDETASIYNFLQELEVRADDMKLLNLTEWAVELEKRNRDFSALMKTRYGETASKTALRMKEVRLETDRCYRDLLDRLDALILLNGKTAFAPFVQDLGVRIERFEQLLAQRAGRSKKEKATTPMEQSE